MGDLSPIGMGGEGRESSLTPIPEEDGVQQEEKPDKTNQTKKARRDEKQG